MTWHSQARSGRRGARYVIVEVNRNLALAVHAGELDALEGLVRAYQDEVFGYTVRLLQDPADAQEVTQDAFLRAHHALTSQYDEEQCRQLAVRPWLFRIARNLAYNRRRTRRPAQQEPLPQSDGWHPPALRYQSTHEHDLELLEERTRLERALGRLSRAGREVIVLRFIEEMSYAEVATVVGTSEAAARGKVFRALRQLRTILMEMEAHDGM